MSTSLKKRLTSVLIQKIIIVFLLMAGLCAMTFGPYEIRQPYEPGGPIEEQYLLRASFIIGGLTGALLSLALLIAQQVNRWKESDPLLQISMAICSLTIGWAAFPYWTNGVFQAYLNIPLGYYTDPKYQIPMLWIGEIWRLGVLLILIIAFFAVPSLFIVSITRAIREHAWKRSITSIFCLTITAAFFLLSPDYLEWLMD